MKRRTVYLAIVMDGCRAGEEKKKTAAASAWQNVPSSRRSAKVEHCAAVGKKVVFLVQLREGKKGMKHSWSRGSANAQKLYIDVSKEWGTQLSPHVM